METQTLKTIRKTGKRRRFSFKQVGALILFLAAANGRADASFTATVDREQISLDESVSLKLSVHTDGRNAASSPQFNAPDFEVVNEYSQTFVESYYENGRFGTRNTQSLTKILKPMKQGTLRITGLRVLVGGQVQTAPDILVQVTGAGAGTPPPRGYGGGGIGLRGAGKRLPGTGVMIRAEINKDRAVKGEQVIVSYYLYRRVRVANISVDKFPTLNGFLREDLEMPVMGTRLDSERVVVDGVAYEKSLLVRYAAYPLQEGKLKVDPMAIKYNYFASNGNGFDDEDPFFSLFQQMAPRSGRSQSEPLSVEVAALPEEGRPQSFVGGVGDFNVTVAVDKYDVRANEAVTLTVKVDGRGNVASIKEPRAKWPESVELYDSKGRAQSGKAGVGDKIFEYLLIPRVPGGLTLPALEFGFFDPVQKKYYTKTTEEIRINVGEPAPGTALVQKGTPPQPAPQATPGAAGTPRKEDVRYLKAPIAEDSSEAWRWVGKGLFFLFIAGGLAFVGLVVTDLARKGQSQVRRQREVQAKAELKSFAQLRKRADAARNGASWQEVISSYEVLSGAVFDALDRTYAVGARSLPRSELKRVLVEERGLAPHVWDKASKLLEFAEAVRYATRAGAVTEAQARQELKNWVSDAEHISRHLK